MSNVIIDQKPKVYRFIDVCPKGLSKELDAIIDKHKGLQLFPDLGKGQGARASNASHWDRDMIRADVLTIGGYSPTEGPIIAFQDELASNQANTGSKIEGAERAPADGNLRGCTIVDICELVAKGKLGEEWLGKPVPVLIYPEGLDQETRERIRNRARDTTVAKSQHDYYCWALKLALKNPTMGDTDLCRLIGPRPIRSQWPNAVVQGSTVIDEKGNERFKPDLPLDSKDGMAMLVNKQGPIQEVTRVRSLPAFARAFFLLHPSESKAMSFGGSRTWSQAWSQDLRARPDFGVKVPQTLRDLLVAYPESKLGALVAVHESSGKPQRKGGRGEGQGAMTSAERERLQTTFAQVDNPGARLIATVVKIVGREVGYRGGEALEFLEAISDHVKLDEKGSTLLNKFLEAAVREGQDAIAKATADEQAEAEKRAKTEAAAVRKAKSAK